MFGSDALKALGAHYADPRTGSDVTPEQEILIIFPSCNCNTYFTSFNHRKNKTTLFTNIRQSNSGMFSNLMMVFISFQVVYIH